ncbi:MAG: hypothetical protein MHM6MM_008254 [Cercozoa sp. M6MM]
MARAVTIRGALLAWDVVRKNLLTGLNRLNAFAREKPERSQLLQALCREIASNASELFAWLDSVFVFALNVDLTDVAPLVDVQLLDRAYWWGAPPSDPNSVLELVREFKGELDDTTTALHECATQEKLTDSALGAWATL